MLDDRGSICIKKAFLQIVRASLICLLIFATIPAKALNTQAPSSSQMSRPQVWLFIGLDAVPPAPFFRPKDWDLRKALGAQFQKYLGAFGFDLRVVERATGADLWDALHSERTIGVFWLGHSGVGTSDLLSKDVTIDTQGMNIAPLFSAIPERLLYLGLISCNGNEVLKSVALQAKPNPVRRVYAFSGLTDAQTSLTRVLANAYLYFGAARQQGYTEILPSPPPPPLSQNIVIRRKSSRPANLDLALKSPSGVIDFFKKSENEHIFRLDLALSDGQLPQKIEVDSLRSAESFGPSDSVDELEIATADGAYRWEPLRMPSGELLGQTRNVYVLKEER